MKIKYNNVDWINILWHLGDDQEGYPLEQGILNEEPFCSSDWENIPVIYVICSHQEQKVKYIGSTDNLKESVQKHLDNNKFEGNQFAYVFIPRDSCEGVKAYLEFIYLEKNFKQIEIVPIVVNLPFRVKELTFYMEKHPNSINPEDKYTIFEYNKLLSKLHMNFRSLRKYVNIESNSLNNKYEDNETK